MRPRRRERVWSGSGSTVQSQFARLDVDGADAEVVALGVFDDDGGHVEAHGLVVEHGAGEGGEVVTLK